MPYADVNRTRLYYEWHGPEAAPVLVLNNGILMNAAASAHPEKIQASVCPEEIHASVIADLLAGATADGVSLDESVLFEAFLIAANHD